LNRKIVIIGAGPAGLTAAYELQSAGERDITVLEADTLVGGISRTYNHKGNRIDIGGHRFFSKSDWVMDWWASILPVAGAGDAGAVNLQYRGQSGDRLPASRPASPADESVLLVRSRLSRIYYNRQFFDYPLRLDFGSLRKLGFANSITFGLSYVRARLFPIRPEATFEDFLVNRFGDRLYRRFFKEYTEKVWGVSCREISAEWGAQRIKSLSITKAVVHAIRSALGLGKGKAAQTSLIESFLYPKYGPGQMWETVAGKFVSRGGRLHLGCRVDGLAIEGGQAKSVTFTGPGGRTTLDCTHVVSTMPIKDLVAASRTAWPEPVVDIASRLAYRDFVTVGLLYRAEDLPQRLDDNWIYIQEPGVQVGRVQVFNNWSPHLVADPSTVWLGLEFFCREGDPLWSMDDAALARLGQDEMRQIGLVSGPSALDSVVLRVPKAYPGYFGEAYSQFDRVRSALDAVDNLFLVGRNGMHRYNNQDHSMLTAREAVEQILSGRVDKKRIWDINVGDEYHEEVERS
jgi:protoporphyrinogen oxidase